MSPTMSKTKAALAADEGKLKKLLKAIKKLLAKEFLWVLIILLLGIPLAFIMMYLLESLASENTIKAMCDVLNGASLYAGCYIISLAGIYFTRMTVGAIKTLIEKKEE